VQLQQAVPTTPRYFSEPDWKLMSRVADLIIPDTDSPGAVASGVPAYIDYVCSRNQTLAKTVREGLKSTAATIDVALLTKLDAEHSPFFTAMKNLTADGFYTSRIGLVEELGYKGNSVLAAFPICEIPEH